MQPIGVLRSRKTQAPRHRHRPGQEGPWRHCRRPN